MINVKMMHNKVTGRTLIARVCDGTEVSDYAKNNFNKGEVYEYVVVSGYNAEDGTWDNGSYYSANSLEYAISDVKNNISYERISELATKFKDGFMECDSDSAMEFFEDECDMTEDEMEYFGIKESEVEL